MPSELLTKFGTTVTWQDSGGTEAITLQNLGNANGRNGAIHDWGAGPRATRYHIKVRGSLEGAGTVGLNVRIAIREAGLGSSPTDPTNDDGGNVVLSSVDKLLNLKNVATLAVDEAAADIVMSVEEVFECAARHFGPVVYNASGASLQNTANDWVISITPMLVEAQ